MVTSAGVTGLVMGPQEGRVCRGEVTAVIARAEVTPEVAHVEVTSEMAREVETPEMAHMEAPTPCCHKSRGNQRGTRRQMSLHNRNGKRRRSRRGAHK